MDPFNRNFAAEMFTEFLGYELPDVMEVDTELQSRWYGSGETDFSIYEGENYLPSILKAYDNSRRNTRTAAEFLREFGMVPKTFLDIGTGHGLFAAILASEFPNCEVTGANLPGRQFDFNQWIAKKLNLPNLRFRLATEIEGEHFEYVLALEFFEHFKEPDLELKRIVKTHDPDFLFESSSFTHRGPGHFSSFLIEGKEYQGYNGKVELNPETGEKIYNDPHGAGPAYRRFSQFLKSQRWERIPLMRNNFNHSRPRFWKKNREPVQEETDVLSMFGS